jgi:antitoxin VapB
MGRSQAIRLPKEFRFDTDVVLVRREGQAVLVEPAHEWPDGYLESFAGIPEDFSAATTGWRRKEDLAHMKLLGAFNCRRQERVDSENLAADRKPPAPPGDRRIQL